MLSLTAVSNIWRIVSWTLEEALASSRPMYCKSTLQRPCKLVMGSTDGAYQTHIYPHLCCPHKSLRSFTWQLKICSTLKYSFPIFLSSSSFICFVSELPDSLCFVASTPFFCCWCSFPLKPHFLPLTPLCVCASLLFQEPSLLSQTADCIF